MAVAAKADRGRVVEVIDLLLCDTPALKGDFEAMAAQRTGDPGGADWSSPRGVSLTLHHPDARCSWDTRLISSAAVLDRGEWSDTGMASRGKDTEGSEHGGPGLD